MPIPHTIEGVESLPNASIKNLGDVLDVTVLF